MYTQRLYAASKRRRQVFREKFILVIAAFMLVVCFSVVLGTRLVAAQGSPDETPIEYKYYKSIELSAGDTLWDIAVTYMDNEEYSSVNDYIKVLKQINNLPSDTIHEGQYLTVVYNDESFK